jgi:hypothetical protein
MSIARIDPDQLYFALLDPPRTRGRDRRDELLYGLESVTPTPIDELHAVFHPLPDRRVLGIAIRRDEGTALASTHHRASPAHWPDWLEQETQSPPPDRINLLTGPLTPPRVIRAKRAVLHLTLIMFVLTALILSFGTERRIHGAQEELARVRSLTDDQYAQALGPLLGSSAQPPAAILTAELRKLQSTRSPGTTTPAAAFNADLLLGRVLNVWPTDTTLRAESITVSQRAVELITTAQTTEDTTALINACKTLDGLSIGTSSSTQARDGIRFELRLIVGDTP